MPTYTITVSKEQEEALKAVAVKDNKTVDSLIQEQLSYYLNCVISAYVEAPIALTSQQKEALNAILASTKADFIVSITEVK